ncbi:MULTISPECIES: hypothetical protein [Burkholderia]|uniref:hypothetical protein n=1 Tax=Burkholderia TaxID=32008 RepID=UPI0004F70960|nr:MULTISPECIES: hypothetical protein [Burkholderia]AIO75261.1 hypothetical protein DM80_2112 [Burkholderia multivorans]MBJ9655905.1 hypothetical protein [Burkholderia multivorans]MBJ9680034.1 hypothetical protein [Burkholderia multivorans]MBU9284145.1 hypothetical protein [Burkholderia multivorans]MBU9402706.1 hypothetical protein [Burkholderia multivorans]
MPAARFLSILISADASQPTTAVKEAMDKSLDWFRLADNYYVAYSTASLNQWKSRLAPIAKPNGFYFVAPLSMEDKVGYVTRAFWDWVDEMPEKHKKKNIK